MCIPVKFSQVFRKVFLQNTYGRLLLEVVSEIIMQNRCSEIISVYKDEHVAFIIYILLVHACVKVFRINKAYALKRTE